MNESENSLAACTVKDIAPEGMFDRIDEVTDKLLAMPQAEMPVIHRFAPGLYIREVHMLAGTFVIGYEHKQEHFNVMLQGHLVMVHKDGSTADFIAPQSYTAEPGQKVAWIVENVVWQNIFPNPEDIQDIDMLEDRLLNKSDQVKINEKQAYALAQAECEVDRYDYGYILDMMDITDTDLGNMFGRFRTIDMPESVHPWRLAKSPINGLGYYLTVNAGQGSILAPAKVYDQLTPAGLYVNHSADPNAVLRMGVDGIVYLMAIKDIPGCMGGGKGTEVTIDYKVLVALMTTNEDKALCQQYSQHQP